MQKSKLKKNNLQPIPRLPLDSPPTPPGVNARGKRSGQAAYNLQPIQGFTLLELLVVISIIAILVTLGLSSFATAQKKGRDAKRKSDLKEVQIALEQYYSVCGSQYPTPADTFFTSIICSSPSLAMMPTVPADPRGITPYYCGPTPGASNCTGTGFTICAMLESEASDIYCIENQQ